MALLRAWMPRSPRYLLVQILLLWSGISWNVYSTDSMVSTNFSITLLRPGMLNHLVILVIRRGESETEMSWLSLWTLDLGSIKCTTIFSLNIWRVSWSVYASYDQFCFLAMLRVGEIRTNHLSFCEKVIEVSARRIKNFFFLMDTILRHCHPLMIYLGRRGNSWQLALH